MNNVLPVTIDSVDSVLGGGIVKGGVIEIWGDEQSGKTGTAISAGRSFPYVFYYDLDGTYPWELHYLIQGKEENFKCIQITEERDWVESLNVEYPEGSLVVYDPISVIHPYLVSGNFNKMLTGPQTTILLSHSNSNNLSPIENSASFFCSQRLQFRNLDKILSKEYHETVGIRTKIMSMKNTLSFPRKTSTMEIYFGVGAM